TELARIETWVKYFSQFPKQHGSKLRDPRAGEAVDMAYQLLSPMCKPTLTAGRPWMELCNLLYEAATGNEAPDLSKYCRERLKSGPPMELNQQGKFVQILSPFLLDWCCTPQK